MMPEAAPPPGVASAPGFREALREHAAILTAYAAMAVAMTWPLAARPWREIMGGPGDNLIFVWNLWWVRESLLHRGQLPFFSDLILRPFEFSFLHHTHTFFHGLIYTLLSPLLRSPILAMNLFILASFPLAGWGMYLLAKRFTGDRRAAFLAGVIFSFSTYRMIRSLCHLNLVANEFLPFYLLFLVKGVEERSRRSFAAAAVVFAAGLWNDYYNALFMAGLTSVYMLAGPLTGLVRPRNLLRAVPAALPGAALGILLIAPFLRGVLQTISTLDIEPYKGIDLYRATPLAYLTPSVYHRLWAGPFMPLYFHHFPGNEVESSVYLGYAALGLALYGLFRARRIAPVQRWVLVLGLLFFALSLGPQWDFSWRRREYYIPLPYRLIAMVPRLSDFRVPARMAAAVSFAAALLAGCGFKILLDRSATGRRSGRAAAAIFAAAVLLENLHAPWMFHFNAKDPAALPFTLLERIRKDPSPGAVFTVPYYPLDYRIPWMQVFHEKPTVLGYLARTGPQRSEYYYRLGVEGWFMPSEAAIPDGEDPYAYGAPSLVLDWLRHKKNFADPPSWTAEDADRFCYFFGIRWIMIAPLPMNYRIADHLRRDCFNLEGEYGEGNAWLGQIRPPEPKFPILVNSAAGSHNFYFIQGFNEPETHGRWAGGGKPALAFRLDRSRRLRIIAPIGAPPHLKTGEQSVRVLINRRPLASLALASAWTQLDAAVPPEFTREGMNYLTFVPEVTASPEDRGMGEDPRILSFLLGPVEIQDVPNP